jgi:predicted  nucleic acid-binding Zn-ribbon protein
MKCQIFVLFAALLGLAAAKGDDDRTPVERVVNMLSDLQAKIVSDGKSEEQIYNKYACWCETTTKRKASDITQAENDLRALGQQILKLKGKIATRAAEIKELSDKIEKNEEEQEGATAMRQKRNAKYMAMQAETKQAIAALEQAIGVLVGGTKLLQTDAALQATSAVQSVIDKLPSDADLNPDHMAFLSEFVSNGAEGTYAPQSATIQGMLSDMYATFATNLEDATTTEAKQNMNFEKLIATLQKEASDMKTVKSRKEEEKADAESDLADTTATYDDTQDQMKADIKFFDETSKACSTKHDEWTLRQKLREAELAGVKKALEFLSSDEARDLFAKSIKPGVEAASFIQIEADNAQVVAAKAYDMLKAQATKSKSLRLAALAVQARTAKFGHFDAVIKAIDEMVGTLKDEAADDLAKKTQCEDEYQKIALAVQDLDWKIKNNEAKIDKLEGLIDMRRKERQETIQQMKETDEYMKKITADRKEEHDEFLLAKKDDQDAVELLNKAKDALTAFYKKNGIKVLMQAEPAFEVSEDQAPEANFADKGNRKGMSNGIVSMMDYIIQDLEDEIINDGKNEAENQADYEGEMKTAQDLMDDLTAKKTSLEDIIAKRNEERSEEIKDHGENNKDRDAELAYQAKIKPDCDWILKNFDGRATARAAEMDGLVSAKEFLAGKVALLQVKQKMPVNTRAADQGKLASIGFLGVH